MGNINCGKYDDIDLKKIPHHHNSEDSSEAGFWRLFPFWPSSLKLVMELLSEAF